MSDQRTMTFRELKEAVNNMPEDQLDRPVIMQREDGVAYVLSLEPVEEDVFYHKDDEEDRGSLADLKEKHGDEFNEADFLPGPTKGTFFLWEKF